MEPDKAIEVVEKNHGELRDIKWLANTYDEFGHSIDPECRLHPLAERIQGIMGELEDQVHKLKEEIKAHKKRHQVVTRQSIKKLDENDELKQRLTKIDGLTVEDMKNIVIGNLPYNNERAWDSEDVDNIITAILNLIHSEKEG